MYWSGTDYDRMAQLVIDIIFDYETIKTRSPVLLNFGFFYRLKRTASDCPLF